MPQPGRVYFARTSATCALATLTALPPLHSSQHVLTTTWQSSVPTHVCHSAGTATPMSLVSQTTCGDSSGSTGAAVAGSDDITGGGGDAWLSATATIGGGPLLATAAGGALSTAPGGVAAVQPLDAKNTSVHSIVESRIGFLLAEPATPRARAWPAAMGFGKLWGVEKMLDLHRTAESVIPNDPHDNPDDRAMAEIHCRARPAPGRNETPDLL